MIEVLPSIQYSCFVPHAQNGEYTNTWFYCMLYVDSIYLYHSRMKTIKLVSCDHNTKKYADYCNI